MQTRNNINKMKKTENKTKWAFRNDYDSKKWEFCGNAYNENEHVDNGQYRYTWAYMSEAQERKAFSGGMDADDICVEHGYSYVMLQDNKVRQGNW